MRRGLIFKITIATFATYFLFAIFHSRSTERKSDDTTSTEEWKIKNVILIDNELEKVRFLMENDFDTSPEFTQQQDSVIQGDSVLPSVTASFLRKEAESKVSVEDVPKMAVSQGTNMVHREHGVSSQSHMVAEKLPSPSTSDYKLNQNQSLRTELPINLETTRSLLHRVENLTSIGGY